MDEGSTTGYIKCRNNARVRDRNRDRVRDRARDRIRDRVMDRVGGLVSPSGIDPESKTK